MGVERQALCEVVFFNVIAGLVEMEMRIRGLKRNHQQSNTNRNRANSAHFLILLNALRSSKSFEWYHPQSSLPTVRIRLHPARGARVGGAPAVPV